MVKKTSQICDLIAEQTNAIAAGYIENGNSETMRMTPGKVTASDNACHADLSLCAEPLQKDEALTTEIKDVKKPTVSSDSDISNTIERNETKITDIPPRAKPFDEKIKLETTEEQLLGSLTSMSSPAVRTSARVIQKMKMDSIRPTTPPPVDKDDHHRNAQKTPNQHRPSKTNWSTVERNLFFDAINEFGKDFESIANYINGKQKRKNATDPTYKAKEHVRLLYYQTFTKISKYLRFSEEVTKKVQELYAIINYGEMRKKIPVDNQKFYMKLRELVYRGSVTWRVKGKNCRIKTPSCPALRKINQVEKWQEDIKLPAKVDVELWPVDNESWYTVQNLAQNPRVKLSLPLQKRLISLIKTLQQKWKSREAKMWDQTMSGSSPKFHQTASQIPNNPSASGCSTLSASTSSNALENSTNGEPSSGHLQSNYSPYSESILCIAPPQDATIHRPYVNLTDFLNSYSICLNSYEERINCSVRGESLCAEHITNVKETIKSNTKRQRHDSGSEKKSPDTKRTKVPDGEKFEHDVMKKSMSSTSQDGMSTTEELIDEREFSSPTYENAFEIEDANCHIPESSSADECEAEINMWNGSKFKFEPPDDPHSGTDLKKESIDQRNMNKTAKKTETKSHMGMNKKRDLRTSNRESFRPLINEEVVQKIRKGWTLYNVGDMTIGDLYIMFGQDSKVRLEYRWISPAQQIEIKTEMTKAAHKPEANVFDAKDIAEDDVKPENAMIGSLSGTINDDIIETKPFNIDVKPKNPLSNKLKQLLELAGMMEKTKRKTSCACGHYCDRGVNKIKRDDVLPRSFISNKTYPTSHNDSTLFRQPGLPTRPNHYEPFRVSVNASRNKQNRWVKGRNTRVSKQVVVQRILPLQPGMPTLTQPYGVLSTPDINSYSLDNSIIKGASSTPVEYKSILTEENLSRMNHLSEDSSPTTSMRSIDNNACNSSVQVEASTSTSTSKHASCDSVIETCDMIRTEDNAKPVYATINTEQGIIDSDEEENNRMRQRLNEDPGIQSLMEISLPSPIQLGHSVDDFYSDGVDSQPPISPMRILRESPLPSDSKWFEENMNDFSLSSFLGRLEENYEQSNSRRSRSPRCVESSSMSTISETSVDYMTRFEELAESMKNESNNIVTP